LGFQWNDGSLSTFIHIWNPGAAPEKASFRVLVHDPKSKERQLELAVPTDETALPARALTSARVQFKPFDETGECAPRQETGGPLRISISSTSPCFPLSGLLVIRNEQTAPALGPSKKLADPETTPVGIILPPHPASDQVQSQILLHSLWLALVPVAIAVVLAWKESRHPFSPVGGSPDWDFSKSWSANVTLFGGLLSALLAFSGLPAQTVILPKNSYMILSIIAISMIGIGPLIFASIQRNGHGILAMFFVSGLVVLWAAFIQFGLVWLIFAELVLANVITASTDQILDVSLIVTGAMLLIYAAVGLRQVAIESEPAAMADKAMAAATTPAAEPTWHLL
jgi:hypothetical protein